MSDIFISYARDDLSRVSALASALDEKGWSVWWDQNIRSGKPFDRVIEYELAHAKCIIVIWSKRSVNSDWVRAEAEDGLSRKILLSVFIEEDVRLPLRFTNIHTEQLADWDGKQSSPSFEKLVSDIRDVLGPPPEVGKTSEYDIPYNKTEWAGKVFQKGDRWDRQTWIECESNKSMIIDAFESTINVSYLEVIEKGKS